MAEIYHSLTDEIKLCNNLIAAMPSTYAAGIMAVRNNLHQIPTADAVEVVRCKDCRYYNKQYFVTGECYGTLCDILRRDYGKNFFCGIGKKREVEHD